MKRNRIILPVLLLAFFIIIPIVTAETNFTPSETWKYPGVPEHYIPPEYFKDAKPATPISESEMITIIISGQTFEQFTGGAQSVILVVPVSYLDFLVNFTNSSSSPTWHYEKNLAQGEPVAMIRMPGTMYDRMLSMSDGKNLELPVSAYVRQYNNLTDLHTQINPESMNVKAAPVSDNPGTRPSPTVPMTTLTTPPRTQPVPLPDAVVIVAILCTIFVAAIRKDRP